MDYEIIGNEIWVWDVDAEKLRELPGVTDVHLGDDGVCVVYFDDSRDHREFLDTLQLRAFEGTL